MLIMNIHVRPKLKRQPGKITRLPVIIILIFTIFAIQLFLLFILLNINSSDLCF